MTIDTLATFALTAAFLAFAGALAGAAELTVIWRETDAPGLPEVIAATALAAGLFLAASWLLIEGMQL